MTYSLAMTVERVTLTNAAGDTLGFVWLVSSPWHEGQVEGATWEAAYWAAIVLRPRA